MFLLLSLLCNANNMQRQILRWTQPRLGGHFACNSLAPVACALVAHRSCIIVVIFVAVRRTTPQATSFEQTQAKLQPSLAHHRNKTKCGASGGRDLRLLQWPLPLTQLRFCSAQRRIFVAACFGSCCGCRRCSCCRCFCCYCYCVTSGNEVSGEHASKVEPSSLESPGATRAA